MFTLTLYVICTIVLLLVGIVIFAIGYTIWQVRRPQYLVQFKTNSGDDCWYGNWGGYTTELLRAKRFSKKKEAKIILAKELAEQVVSRGKVVKL